MLVNFLQFALVASIGVSAATMGYPHSPVPGYPWGGPCLSDRQAQFIAEQYRQILANPDRSAANATAQALMATTYTETSDSINFLAGYPLGSTTFPTKAAFIEGAIAAPALPQMTTLKVFHDCTNILWQWRVTGLGLNKYPVKGFNTLAVDPITGIIQATELEFDNIAWGENIGWTCSAPSGGAH